MAETVQGIIFVLTDTPAIYGSEMDRGGVPPVFVRDIDTLITRLADVTVAGMVLEISKVMKAERKDRDRLFSYSGTFPVLRTKINARHGYPIFLDSKDSFFANLEAVEGKRRRSHERKKVTLSCSFSSEDDPSMAQPMEATIRDISSGGCFISTDQLPDGQPFLHVCIPELGCNRPIFSSVRWTRCEGDDKKHCGMGVFFIDIGDEQVKAIEEYQP
ncbi:PilZ domain-containing protein [Pseudodesulfovibrio sp. zrk46]|uniref:PilZ domain-containing protein n=1 Tax=Pseudodesulfovibrio sp. zrk46 TaxID=2725288 RepID=UPI0014494499|nr:PilZ domain-containing protein [Pseudodesulfovibrio sp. zrk46]QJB56223.1 PilZ domain-containing protein [Pseudodesulfovibrio sp. zrk46]